MTFAAYWQRLVAATPELADPEARMTITAASLRRTVERAYNQGRDDQLAGMRDQAGIEASDMPDFFKDLFR